MHHNQFKAEGKTYWMHLCVPCDLWFSPIKDFESVNNDQYFHQFEGIEDSRIEQARIRLDQIRKHFDLHQKSVLEIGCAYGDLLGVIKQEYSSCSVQGLEDSQKLCEHNQNNGLPCNPEISQIEVGSVDLVVANHVIEHFQTIDDFFSILNHAGRRTHEVFISLPNRKNYWVLKGLIPDLHVPFHRYYYTLNQILTQFQNRGYTVLEARTVEAGRAKANLTQAFYNQYRSDLDTFKKEYPQRLEELENIKNWEELERQIEAAELGSETLIYVRTS